MSAPVYAPVVEAAVARRLVPSRIAYKRAGFRAKLSAGWFALDKLTRKAVAGPFPSKDVARFVIGQLKEAAMATDKSKTTERTERTERTTEKPSGGGARRDRSGEGSGDPSDSASSRNDDPNKGAPSGAGDESADE